MGDPSRYREPSGPIPTTVFRKVLLDERVRACLFKGNGQTPRPGRTLRDALGRRSSGPGGVDRSPSIARLGYRSP